MNTLCQHIIDDATSLDKQIALLQASGGYSLPTVHAGIEKHPLVLKDQKIPFEWFQAGNTGNTGGGSARPHGTCSWKTGKETTISIAPAGAYDNFFFYCVLPLPSRPPRRLRWSVSNWNGKTAADWSKSQQFEFQIEEFRGGYQYTCAWAINPSVGLRYWATDKWVAFDGGKTVNNLSAATAIISECSLDQTAHTYTYEWIVVNGVTMPVGITVPCHTASASAKQYSVAVQLDATSAGAPYSAILDNLTCEWQ
jgi:hypothetical protein